MRRLEASGASGGAGGTKAPLGLAWGAVLSAALFALRWHLAGTVGFGDAEALYACYALHPQPGYVDHPGLVGSLARLLGGDLAPTPLVAHRFTVFAATLLPWLGLAAARASGARPERAFRTFFALALLPEMSVGLFGLTPDLPLALAWLGTLAAGALLFRSAPGTQRALAGALGAGFFAGLAVTAKASGVLLAVALCWTLASRHGRPHLRTLGPWCGLAVLGVLVAPLALWEVREGLPMLTHRLVSTQGGAGFSLRNAGALLGGQLLYATPPFLVGGYFVLRGVHRRRAEDAAAAWLLDATVVPGVPLILLCLWSRVAEPHWVAPAYLALAVGASLFDPPGARLDRACIGVGLLAPALAWTLVATPAFPRFAGAGYVPRHDLVNDLYAWRVGTPLVAEALLSVEGTGQHAVVVGAHWTISAQVHAALGPEIPVGSLSTDSDFSRWLPRERWVRARFVLFVTDDRFSTDAARAFPEHDAVSVDTARVYRGGRVVRTIRVVRLERAAVASCTPTRRPREPLR